jgi:propanol-preferring alcohol dehydrogenase
MTQTLGTLAASDTTTDTMRAAVVTEFGAPLQISELELPTPGYGEALVKLETSGVCHTDLHTARRLASRRNRRSSPATRGYGTVVTR